MSNIYRILNLLVLLIILGCKDEFILEPDYYDQVMIVDGMISNEPGPYTINLSLTAPINSGKNTPLKDCIVTLYENTGKTEILTETEPGKYVTSIEGMQGIVGNEYSISIFSPDGAEYESDFQELKQAVEIDSVYVEIDNIAIINYPFSISGYQFYVDTKSATTQENYFRWSITETFEYNSDYQFYAFEYSGGRFYYHYRELEESSTCWKTQKVKYLFTGNTSNLSIPQITHQPLHFVSTETKKLSKRYSILLTQYTFGEKEYKYWQEMEKLISEENYLVISQPYNITGNINNPNEKVCGYFTVASVAQKRIFVDKPNLAFYYNTCSLLTDPQGIESFKQSANPPYYWVFPGGEMGLVMSVGCIDCTSERGIITKPDFWLHY